MISFCSNIFPAPTWADTRRMLAEHLPSIRRELVELGSPLSTESLGLGLWLSAVSAKTLCDSPLELQWLKELLAEHHFAVETMNGFPYGDFHGERVKEQVFLPDWSSHERFAYTCMLFELLAQLAPAGGSPLCVSTVPASYRGFNVSREAIFAHLDAMVGFLSRLSIVSGRDFILALEPEPFGLLDDTLSTVNFMHELRQYSRRAQLVERFIAVTYDTCHFAVMGEDAVDVFDTFMQNNVRVAKIQWSNAITLSLKEKGDLEMMYRYDEPRYFHQTSIQFAEEERKLYKDLSLAIEWMREDNDHAFPAECTAHFHVPLHAQFDAPWGSTEQALRRTIEALPLLPEPAQFEVETYTWSVLPEAYRQSLGRQIASEMEWLRSALA